MESMTVVSVESLGEQERNALAAEHFDVEPSSVPRADGKDEAKEGHTPIRTIIQDENRR